MKYMVYVPQTSWGMYEIEAESYLAAMEAVHKGGGDYLGSDSANEEGSAIDKWLVEKQEDDCGTLTYKEVNPNAH